MLVLSVFGYDTVRLGSWLKSASCRRKVAETASIPSYKKRNFQLY